MEVDNNLYHKLYKALHDPYMKAMLAMKGKGYDIKKIFGPDTKKYKV